MLVALEAVARKVPLGDATRERVEELAREATDGHLREYALFVLLADFSAKSRTGPTVATLLFEEFRARQELTETPEANQISGIQFQRRGRSPQRRRATRGVRQQALATRKKRRSSPFTPSAPDTTDMTDRLQWVVAAHEPELALFLYPGIVAATDSDEGRDFHRWYLNYCIAKKDRGGALSLLLGKAVGFEDAARKEHGYRALENWSLPQEQQGRWRAFLKSVATDERLYGSLTVEVVKKAGLPSFEWFDWARSSKAKMHG